MTLGVLPVDIVYIGEAAQLGKAYGKFSAALLATLPSGKKLLAWRCGAPRSAGFRAAERLAEFGGG